MNKKILTGFVVVFFAMAITNIIIHSFILAWYYESEEVANVWRSDMSQKMWIYYLIYIIVSYFYVLIFSKWQKGKGIIEGIQYGTYTGFIMSVSAAYSMYAMIPMPYSVAFQWMIYGLIQYIIFGILLAFIFGRKPQEAPAR